jgi:hypothetical protein
MTEEKVLVAPLNGPGLSTNGSLDPEAAPDALFRRMNGEPEEVERVLAQLVLTIVELLRQLMERQALRRVETGGLADQQIERLGQGLMLLAKRWTSSTSSSVLRTAT